MLQPISVEAFGMEQMDQRGRYHRVYFFPLIIAPPTLSSMSVPAISKENIRLAELVRDQFFYIEPDQFTRGIFEMAAEIFKARESSR